MAAAEPEPGDLVGVRVAEDLPVGGGGGGGPAQGVGAEEARRLEAEELREGRDGVGEEAVQEQQSYEGPLEEGVYEDYDDLRGVVSVEKSSKFVGSSH